MQQTNQHIHEPVILHAKTDIPLLDCELTVGGALDTILARGVGEKIVYFYVIDDEKRLMGIIPTRRLLTTPRDRNLTDIMIRRVVKLLDTATIYDALELFVMYRFLAFPVVDEENHMLGVVDVSLFTDEIISMPSHEQIDTVFETIGYRLDEVKSASALTAFRYRFPWLLATIGSGTACALLTGAFAATLAQALIIAFFMTLLLGLGESVSIQSMTVTIQTIGSRDLTISWFAGALKKEIVSALLLGIGCGATVSLIVLAWQGFSPAVPAIGGSIVASIFSACVIGLTVPSIIHALKLDPKISAGPITLALADISTLAIYFTIASLVL